MSHFILPVTIDSRKVVFLDIKTNSTNDLFPNKVADSFIIRLPEGVINQTSLLQFKKSRILQALTLGKKDIVERRTAIVSAQQKAFNFSN